MKVILCEDVDNLGDMGQQVNVAPGYARNFLLPRKLAVVSDSASAKQIEHEMRIIKKREEKKRKELTEVSKDISKLVVEFSSKAGAEGKLFGSITTLHIANKLEEITVSALIARTDCTIAQARKAIDELEEFD